MLFNQFALAEHLHKTVHEIEQITIDEWHYWLAYFKIKKEKQKKIN
ncbi:hypothetical protein RHORCCE3_0443 [Rickettsia hoogstraalii str. RCCE3]|nr:hypothetical protein RHORCCE3_0443 [Rickettsia hoogstraalii str. RCCE3]